MHHTAQNDPEMLNVVQVWGQGWPCGSCLGTRLAMRFVSGDKAGHAVHVWGQGWPCSSGLRTRLAMRFMSGDKAGHAVPVWGQGWPCSSCLGTRLARHYIHDLNPSLLKRLLCSTCKMRPGVVLSKKQTFRCPPCCAKSSYRTSLTKPQAFWFALGTTTTDRSWCFLPPPHHTLPPPGPSQVVRHTDFFQRHHL